MLARICWLLLEPLLTPVFTTLEHAASAEQQACWYQALERFPPDEGRWGIPMSALI
jgi:hypothetical protein